MTEAIGTLLGLCWGACGIAAYFMSGGGTWFGTWRGALLLGPIALFVVLSEKDREL